MSAPVGSVNPTGDLRSGAQDTKRYTEHKHKWEFGESFGPGRKTTAHARPAKPLPRAYYRKAVKGLSAKGVHRSAITADRDETLKTPSTTQSQPVTDSSSGDEDIDPPCAAPAPDSDITYSFDAPRGPSHGSQVLGNALDRAIAQFENSATDRLVRDEYEVLDSTGEAMKAAKSKARSRASKGGGAIDEDVDDVDVNADEEYEFV